MQKAYCGTQFHKKLLELCTGLSYHSKTATGQPQFVLQHFTVINTRLYICICGNNRDLAAEAACLFLEITEMSTKCHIMPVPRFFLLFTLLRKEIVYKLWILNYIFFLKKRGIDTLYMNVKRGATCCKQSTINFITFSLYQFAGV